MPGRLAACASQTSRRGSADAFTADYSPLRRRHRLGFASAGAFSLRRAAMISTFVAMIAARSLGECRLAAGLLILMAGFDRSRAVA